MTAVIEDCRLQIEKQTYHIKVNYKDKLYLFIVETLSLANVETSVISSITRGVTYWDCGLELRLSDKRKIKPLIKQHILKILNK